MSPSRALISQHIKKKTNKKIRQKRMCSNSSA
jgi:hypothetical protein